MTTLEVVTDAKARDGRCLLPPRLFRSPQQLFELDQPMLCYTEQYIAICRAWPWTDQIAWEASAFDPLVTLPALTEGSTQPNQVIVSPLTDAPQPALRISVSVISGKSFITGYEEELVRVILDNLPVKTGAIVGRYRAEIIELEIVSTEPSGIVVIFSAEKTQIQFEAPRITDSFDQPSAPPLGGLDNIFQSLYQLLIRPLQYPELFYDLSADCPKGVLLYGPPGVGKTLLVRSVAKACDAKLISVNAPDILGSVVGESERNLREKFEQASQMLLHDNKPCVLFIDEIDALCPPREKTSASTRLVGQLLTLMDGVKSRGRLVVIGATNRPNAIDLALRRSGRFDREIAIGVPTVEQRLDILRVANAKMTLESDVSLETIARQTIGFVGADLVSLCRTAGLLALDAFRQQQTSEAGLPERTVSISSQHLATALERTQPSTLRESVIQLDRTIHWGDIGGLEQVKQRVRRAVEWPMLHRDSFTRLGLRSPRGVLLYGPPGCSKTTMVKAMAATAGATFLSLSGAAIYSPFVGDAERTVRELFSRGRSAAPAVLFFDEIDAIVSKRKIDGHGGDSQVQDRLLSTLLNEMDGIEAAEGILVIGATNRVDMLDAALLRPGRFDEIIYVPPPDQAARKDIFRVHTRKMQLASDVNLSTLANMTENYSGADIENVCREAAMMALRESINASVVSTVHFDRALQVIPASLTTAALAEFAHV